MKHLQVAVGIIRNARKEIFLAQRSASSHMANMWEFPGGKIEAEESAAEALKRELLEETGIEVTAAEPFDTADHTYEDLRVTLHFFIVEAWNGEPYGREGQPMRWVPQAQLVAAEFPPANIPIVARLLAEITG
ncbi:8-oxo-dGTP diphosphatase [Erwinia toletana]|uniref:8-oxo-dGTP diphosphatase n=1 Tax=Winslowiella toletana TaxID=92490 RepID=A0ABS4PCX8_9GAMM|nr:8-oxo-dGTP diphosphatase MutT [Winslowiella toletana]MBP2169783.1 8-oxo-dGTP diphosphatase [Winslowiella toletana]